MMVSLPGSVVGISSMTRILAVISSVLTVVVGILRGLMSSALVALSPPSPSSPVKTVIASKEVPAGVVLSSLSDGESVVMSSMTIG